MAPRKTKTPTFEEGLERLEAIVDQMERGDMPLDEMMKLYEEGVKLSGELNQKLEAADSRMLEVRLGRDGEPKVTDSDVAQQQTLLDGLMDE